MDKKRINKKHMSFGLVALLLVIFAIFGIRSTLKAGKEYVPENTVNAMDSSRSQVYVSGKDYKLDKKTKQQHQNIEKKRQKILEEEEEQENQQSASRRRAISSKNTTRKDAKGNKVKTEEDRRKEKQADKTRDGGSGGSDDDGSSKKKKRTKPTDQNTDDPDDITKRSGDPDEDDYYKLSEEERKLVPVIETSLRDGGSYKGKTLKFTVKAYADSNKAESDCIIHNQTGTINVYLNGIKVQQEGQDGKTLQYRPRGVKGSNTAKITAVNKSGKKRTITRRVTYNPDEKGTIIGSVTVNISADSIGVGTIESGISVSIEEQEPLNEILEEAFKKVGITPNMSTSYLAGLRRANIAMGATITDDQYEKARKNRTPIDPPGKWPSGWENHLNEKDFCSSSGWIYKVNGNQPGKSIGSYIPNDGDDIELEFSLFEG